MKLSQWAKLQGIHYNTALKWFKQGKIPNAYQLDTGTILIDNKPQSDEYKYDKIIELLNEIKNKLIGGENDLFYH